MEFDGQKIRKAQTPPISRAWMARKMGIGYQFLYYLEHGAYPWPPKRKAQFEEIVAEWKTSPAADQRLRRSDAGKKHRKRKRRRTPDKAKLFCPPPNPVPVPHPHGEIVGIG